MQREYFQIFPWSRMSHHLGHFSSDLKSSHCLELHRNSTEKASPYPQSPISNCRPLSRPVKAELWLLFHKEAKVTAHQTFPPHNPEHPCCFLWKLESCTSFCEGMPIYTKGISNRQDKLMALQKTAELNNHLQKSPSVLQAVLTGNQATRKSLSQGSGSSRKTQNHV